jgi:prepilin-type N-terminal cleavage/methylation domain-containing protein
MSLTGPPPFAAFSLAHSTPEAMPTNYRWPMPACSHPNRGLIAVRRRRQQRHEQDLASLRKKLCANCWRKTAHLLNTVPCKSADARLFAPDWIRSRNRLLIRPSWRATRTRGPARCKHMAVHRAGYTLVEMLVGIAILAILAALVLAALTPMRHAANRAGSLSTLRQLGAAAAGYRAEHAGRLPPRLADTSPAKSFIGYFRDAGYVGASANFLSPAAPRRKAGDTGVTGGVNRPWRLSPTDQSSYALNYALSRHVNGGPGTHANAFGPLLQHGTSPELSGRLIPMFVDCTWPGFSATTAEWDQGRIPFGRYGDSLTVLFLSGSASVVREDKIRELIWNKSSLKK